MLEVEDVRPMGWSLSDEGAFLAPKSFTGICDHSLEVERMNRFDMREVVA